MKVLFSTIKLAEDIELALISEAKTFDIIGKTYSIIFTGKATIDCSANPIVGHSELCYYGNFNPEQWTRIMTFLKQLPEQPIVIEFTQYAHIVRHEEP